MLFPTQYSLAEANQMVPFLETSFEGIGALLVRMHQIRLHLSTSTGPETAQLEPAPVETADAGALEAPAAAASVADGPARLAEGEAPPARAAVEEALAAYGRLMRALGRPSSDESAAGAEASAEASAEEAGYEGAHWRSALHQTEGEIRRELELLQRMGVLVHSLDPPTVHLRSQRGATPVMLSWRPGEPAFLHWHSLDWGFEERAPIDDPRLFGSAVLPC